MDKYQISERSACGLVGLSRTTWRYQPIPRDDETPMRAEVIRLVIPPLITELKSRVS